MPKNDPLAYSHSPKNFGSVKTKNKNPRPNSKGTTGMGENHPALGGPGQPVPPSPVHSPGRAKGNR